MRTRLIVLLSAIGGFLPLVTDGFLPALRPMMAELGTDVGGAQLAISLALAGFACAQLVVGVLADRYGRRPVLLVATGLFALASLGVLSARSLAAVLTFRFLQGVSAAAGPVLSRAVVRDLCGRVEGARILSLVGMGLATVPLLVPVINAQVVVAFGWRAALIVYLAYLAATLVMTFAWFDETLAERDPQALALGDLARTTARVLSHPQALGYILCCVFGYAGLAVWISAAPHLLLDYYGQPASRFGLYWAIPVMTYLIGGYLSARGLRRYSSDTMLKAAAAVLLASGAALVLLLWLRPASLALFVAAVACYNCGWSIMQPQAQAGALSYFPASAGRVSAVLGCLQMLGGAAIGLLFSLLHDGTPRATSLLIAATALAATLARVTLTQRAPAAARAA